MESTVQLPVVQPQIIQDAPQPDPAETTQPANEAANAWFPLWSKWVDGKGKLWIIVGHSNYAMIDNHHTAASVHCLDMAREYEQICHISDLRRSLQRGYLTRLFGHIIPEAIKTSEHDAQTTPPIQPDAGHTA